MANKSIKYTARDYDSIRNELISFSKQYYPELSDNFNDSSVMRIQDEREIVNSSAYILFYKKKNI